MKKYFIVANIWKIIEAALLITVGVLTIVSFGVVELQSVIGMIAAICIVVDGALNLIFYFFRVMFREPSRGGLILSIAEIALGVFLIVKESNPTDAFVVKNFTLIVAILLTVVGGAIIVEAVAKTIAKSDRLLALIGEFTVGAIALALGIVALVFTNIAANIMLIITGSLIILAGVLLLFVIVLAFVAAHKAGKTIREFFESDISTSETIKEATGK